MCLLTALSWWYLIATYIAWYCLGVVNWHGNVQSNRDKKKKLHVIGTETGRQTNGIELKTQK